MDWNKHWKELNFRLHDMIINCYNNTIDTIKLYIRLCKRTDTSIRQTPKTDIRVGPFFSLLLLVDFP